MDAVRVWLPRGLGAIAFALYAWVAPAGPYWLDSAELTAAGVRLGSAHPSGFPLYLILVKAASLVPVGEIAFRVNLLSAACAALAVVAVARLVDEASRPDRAAPMAAHAASIAGAVTAAAALALCLVFFRHATVAEVYAPTGALIAWALLLLFRIGAGADARSGLTLALVCGLGLAVHASFRLLLAVPVVLVLIVRLRRGARWPLVAPVVVVGVALAVHAELPVRSATGRTEPVDWGHPRTAGALWDHVNARSIRISFAGEMMSRDAALVNSAARAFAADIGDQLGPVALVFSALGLACLVRRRRGRWLLVALVVVGVGDAAYAVWINPMGLIDLQNGVPLAIALCAAAGIGVAWLARGAGRSAPFAGAALGVVVALQPLLVGWAPVTAAGQGDLPRRWAEAGLDPLPPRAIALTQSDSTSSALLYLSAVEAARPDVVVLVRQLLPDRARTEAALRRTGSPLRGARPLDDVLGSGRAIGWEMGDDAIPAGRALVQGVPLAALVPAPAPASDDVSRAVAALREMFASPAALDPAASRVQAHALTSLGRAEFGRGRFDRAGALFAAAVAVRPDHVEALVNLGVVEARSGQLARAVDTTERALALAPGRITALINAARYRAALGDTARAREHAARALEIDPHNRSARELLSRLPR